MARNLGREFATMTDEERRRFELERGPADATAEGEAAQELELDDPRDEDRMGRQYGSLHEEIADPEHRDGSAAQLDDASHQRAVAAEARKQRARRHRDG